MLGGQRDHTVVAEDDKAGLRPGKYLIKAYVDSQGVLADQPAAFLTDREFRGQLTVDAQWREGFKNAQVVSGADLNRP